MRQLSFRKSFINHKKKSEFLRTTADGCKTALLSTTAQCSETKIIIAKVLWCLELGHCKYSTLWLWSGTTFCLNRPVQESKFSYCVVALALIKETRSETPKPKNALITRAQHPPLWSLPMTFFFFFHINRRTEAENIHISLLHKNEIVHQWTTGLFANTLRLSRSA
jgi:hypothetical protein